MPLLTPQRQSLALAAFAGLLWAGLTFGHGLGLDLTNLFFDWARTPGILHPEGGRAGFAVAERSLILVFGSLALVVVAHLAWCFRRAPLAHLGEAAVPWVLWAALLYLAWKTVILYASELVHFAQYALIGALVALALKRGRRPQLAFVIALALGFLDEVWQHYGLHVWILGESTHWMDWSDPILDALGACAGILPFVTRQRLERQDVPSEFGLVKAAFVVSLLLFAPLLALSPVTTSSLLGSYPYHPFWDEHVNLKAVHWLHPHEGIPLLLGMILVLGTVLDPRSRSLSQRSMAAGALLLILVFRPESRAGGREVHEVVASCRVPHVTAAAPSVTAGSSIVVDGSLDEPAWDRAARVGPFVNNVTGRPDLTCDRGDGPRPAPVSETHARLLWDDGALYVALEVTDPDVWARDLARDNGGVAGDEGIRIFIDDGGDEITYYEVDVTPLNAVYDAFNLIPSAPVDYNPWSRQIGLPHWDAAGIRTGVAVHGQVDVVGLWSQSFDGPLDRGYTVEAAIPWEAFRTTTTPSFYTIRQTPGPQPGDRWRLGLYRVERPRPTGPGEAQQRAAAQCIENQAWTPTYVDFHQPSRFGVVEFLGPGAGTEF